ncbi:MAG: hypothetical protein NTZ87_01150 [Candidatus Nomurabacteria bacterium]|nr:hypothetical protein [Candidatus Nomurabacteria bacterium]
MKFGSERLNPIMKTAIHESHFKGTRELLNGSLFSESDKGLLLLLKDSLADAGRRKKLLDMLSYRHEDPVPLSQIIQVFDKFSDLQANVELTPEDIKLVNFAIKYFENWFYDGAWAKISHKQNENPNAYAYLSVPAGIINLLTKLKDSAKSADEIVGFDPHRLVELQKEVRGFADAYLLSERLRAILKEKLNPEKKEKTEFILENHEAMLRTFHESERSVQSELVSGSGSSHSKAPELYLVKTALIAREKMRREQAGSDHWVFVPDVKIDIDRGRYQLFDFSEGQDGHSSMHYPKDRIPYARFLVEYLRTRKGK